MRALSLRGCGLAQLPAALGDLRQLRHLDCSDNQLTQLPDSLGRLAELHTLIWSTMPSTGCRPAWAHCAH